jgi:hypothetical protein
MNYYGSLWRRRLAPILLQALTYTETVTHPANALTSLVFYEVGLCHGDGQPDYNWLVNLGSDSAANYQIRFTYISGNQVPSFSPGTGDFDLWLGMAGTDWALQLPRTAAGTNTCVVRVQIRKVIGHAIVGDVQVTMNAINLP